jgi:uncharacterized protein YndB with AHSA1/START domain
MQASVGTGPAEVPAAKGRVIVRRPLEEVFAFVADFENEPRWKPGLVLEVERLSPSGQGVGTKYREVLSAAGERVEQTFEVTEYEPNLRIGFVAEASGTRGLYEVEPVAEGTMLTFTVRPRRSGLSKVLEPLRARQAGERLQPELDRLRDLLERPASA